MLTHCAASMAAVARADDAGTSQPERACSTESAEPAGDAPWPMRARVHVSLQDPNAFADGCWHVLTHSRAEPPRDDGPACGRTRREAGALSGTTPQERAEETCRLAYALLREGFVCVPLMAGALLLHWDARTYTHALTHSHPRALALPEPVMDAFRSRGLDAHALAQLDASGRTAAIQYCVRAALLSSGFNACGNSFIRDLADKVAAGDGIETPSPTVAQNQVLILDVLPAGVPGRLSSASFEFSAAVGKRVDPSAGKLEDLGNAAFLLPSSAPVVVEATVANERKVRFAATENSISETSVNSHLTRQPTAQTAAMLPPAELPQVETSAAKPAPRSALKGSKHPASKQASAPARTAKAKEGRGTKDRGGPEPEAATTTAVPPALPDGCAAQSIPPGAPPQQATDGAIDPATARLCNQAPTHQRTAVSAPLMVRPDARTLRRQLLCTEDDDGGAEEILPVGSLRWELDDVKPRVVVNITPQRFSTGAFGAMLLEEAVASISAFQVNRDPHLLAATIREPGARMFTRSLTPYGARFGSSPFISVLTSGISTAARLDQIVQAGAVGRDGSVADGRTPTEKQASSAPTNAAPSRVSNTGFMLGSQLQQCAQAAPAEAASTKPMSPTPARSRAASEACAPQKLQCADVAHKASERLLAMILQDDSGDCGALLQWLRHGRTQMLTAQTWHADALTRSARGERVEVTGASALPWSQVVGFVDKGYAWCSTEGMPTGVAEALLLSMSLSCLQRRNGSSSIAWLPPCPGRRLRVATPPTAPSEEYPDCAEPAPAAVAGAAARPDPVPGSEVLATPQPAHVRPTAQLVIRKRAKMVGIPLEVESTSTQLNFGDDDDDNEFVSTKGKSKRPAKRGAAGTAAIKRKPSGAATAGAATAPKRAKAATKMTPAAPKAPKATKPSKTPKPAAVGTAVEAPVEPRSARPRREAARRVQFKFDFSDASDDEDGATGPAGEAGDDGDASMDDEFSDSD